MTGHAKEGCGVGVGRKVGGESGSFKSLRGGMWCGGRFWKAECCRKGEGARCTGRYGKALPVSESLHSTCFNGGGRVGAGLFVPVLLKGRSYGRFSMA